MRHHQGRLNGMQLYASDVRLGHAAEDDGASMSPSSTADNPVLPALNDKDSFIWGYDALNAESLGRAARSSQASTPRTPLPAFFDCPVRGLSQAIPGPPSSRALPMRVCRTGGRTRWARRHVPVFSQRHTWSSRSRSPTALEIACGVTKSFFAAMEKLPYRTVVTKYSS